MIKNFYKKIEGKWIFLAFVLILYGIIFSYNSSTGREVFFEFLFIFKKVAPIFAVVFFLMFLFRLFLPPKKITQFLGKNSGLTGWIIVIFVGTIAMGPIYMWHPLIRDLRNKGMRIAFCVTFLYNRSIKLPVLPMMVYYFGMTFTVTVIIYMIIFSVIDGIVVEKILKNT